GRVDDVDLVIAPEAGGRGGGDGDAALLLLLHPVHDGGAFVDLADLVTDPGIEKNPLGGRGLARIDMRHDADVSAALEREGAGHGEYLVSAGACAPGDRMNELLEKERTSSGDGGLYTAECPASSLRHLRWRAAASSVSQGRVRGCRAGER